MSALDGLGDANDIALADEDTFRAMEELYLQVKQTLGKNPWVTASKLCARKRPGLFPVRDKLTCALLALLPHGGYPVDWQVFRLLMLPESGVVEALYDLRGAATEGADRSEVAIDAYPLRWLDALLWMRAKNLK